MPEENHVAQILPRQTGKQQNDPRETPGNFTHAANEFKAQREKNVTEKQRNLLRRLHTACQHEDEAILAWWEGLPQECRDSGLAALSARDVAIEVERATAALGKLREIDLTASETFLSTEYERMDAV